MHKNMAVGTTVKLKTPDGVIIFKVLKDHAIEVLQILPVVEGTDT